MNHRGFVPLIFSIFYAACANPPPFPIPGRPTPQAELTDPFVYCAVMGTVDSPDARYIGEKTPEAVVGGLRKALKIPVDTPMGSFAERTFWRCMNGKLLACNAGANIPCTSKADRSPIPRLEMVEFCQIHPNSESIPAAVTGRNTIYEWSCTNGEPTIVQESLTPDARGFVSEYWHEIAPP